MNTQPEALDLADWLESVSTGLSANKAAAELRRLHAENEALRAALEQPGVEPVAWGCNRFIEDDKGVPIGTDDPELHWGKYAPNDGNWFPLYAAPQPAQQAEVTMFNPASNSPETALQMAAVIALRDEQPAQAAATHPMQPIELVGGVARFKKNAMVNHLYDWAVARGMGMNEMAAMGFSPEDWMQFAQLIGYSVGGYGDLSYVTDESYDAAASKVSDLLKPAQQAVEPVETTPSHEQLKHILSGLSHCHSRDSQHEFLRVWIRDWTNHKISKAQQADARTAAIKACIDRLIQGGKPAEAGMLRHHFAKDLGEE